jgi:hypothetical protein
VGIRIAQESLSAGDGAIMKKHILNRISITFVMLLAIGGGYGIADEHRPSDIVLQEQLCKYIIDSDINDTLILYSVNEVTNEQKIIFIFNSYIFMSLPALFGSAFERLTEDYNDSSLIETIGITTIDGVRWIGKWSPFDGYRYYSGEVHYYQDDIDIYSNYVDRGSTLEGI